jgi:flagellar secretion chaperone FliS
MSTTAYLETRVLTADPVELIGLLYQRALDVIGDARRYLEAGDIAGRGRAISKAVAILGELNNSLDHKVGGQLSANLEQLYRYMMMRLTQANVRKADTPLAEVESLLTTLAQAWKQVEREHAASVAAEEAVLDALPAAGVWTGTAETGSAHMWDA